MPIVRARICGLGMHYHSILATHQQESTYLVMSPSSRLAQLKEATS